MIRMRKCSIDLSGEPWFHRAVRQNYMRRGFIVRLPGNRVVDIGIRNPLRQNRP